jgi:alpha-beta hydrolase superfamily lysophospholipase
MPTIKSKDGTTLLLHHWPRAEARAKVIIVHGYGEHATRYTELAHALVEAGFVVLAYDQRGHGESEGRRGYIDAFSQYLEDLDVIIAESERLAPGLPRLVIGHSMGGLVTTAHVIDRSPRHAGVILSSPFFRLRLAVPAWKTLLGKAASRLHPTLSIPSGLSGKEVARDPEIAKLYDADPLNLKAATARWFTECVATQEHVFANADRFTLPVLLMHGEADGVADPARSAEIFPRLGSSDKTLELVPGAFHEIYNEPPADRVRITTRSIEWLNQHLA